MGANMPSDLLIEKGSSGLAKARTGDVISEIFIVFAWYLDYMLIIVI